MANSVLRGWIGRGGDRQILHPATSAGGLRTGPPSQTTLVLQFLMLGVGQIPGVDGVGGRRLPGRAPAFEELRPLLEILPDGLKLPALVVIAGRATAGLAAASRARGRRLALLAAPAFLSRVLDDLTQSIGVP